LEVVVPLLNLHTMKMCGGVEAKHYTF